MSELLELVFARPKEAVARAQALLDSRPSPYDASIAHHTIGLAHREYGDLTAAITEMRRALALARRSGSPDRIADVLATLGIAIVQSGRTGRGLAVLQQAVEHATGAEAARVRFRRSGALWILGRHQEALADLRVAIPVLRKAKDELWTARALTLRGLVHLALGAIHRAGADLDTAERMFAEIHEEHASALALHNRGLVAFRSGDLPGALACLDEVGRRYRALGTPVPELIIDRCRVMLAAGLAQDAVTEAAAAVTHSAQLRGRVTMRAELLLIAARAALAAGMHTEAERDAAAAVALFAGQHREWWHAHARLVLLQARFAAGTTSGRLHNQAVQTARQLAALGSAEVVQAHLLAGRVALARGTSWREHLAKAAQARDRGPSMSRVDGWLAQALLAEADGDQRRMLTACRRGLDVLDEHRHTLGATELRVRATAHGAELAELGQRAYARSPRRLLRWSERWRATASAVRPVTDPAAVGELAALRDITSRIWLAHEQGTPTHTLEAEQRRLERRIRHRALRLPSNGHGPAGSLDVSRLLDAIGSGHLLELVDIDGRIHVLVCGSGRVVRVTAGRSDAAAAAVEAARFALRRLAYRPGQLPPKLGSRLQEVLLGPAAELLGDGPVVIVPPGRLHGVPWALLPALADRVHTVAPSASAWLRSRKAPSADRTVLVRGPGLGEEVPALTKMYGEAEVLQNGSATAAQVLASIDGAGLAHIAAHGTFRSDNPLFSSMQLDDGPLTVYDFERLGRAPLRIVLPSCDSGRLQPVGADELLGLTSALLPLGTVGIVASVIPVNDAATVPLMIALHESLRTGATCAEALLEARRAMAGDPTALSYVALGAG